MRRGEKWMQLWRVQMSSCSSDFELMFVKLNNKDTSNSSNLVSHPVQSANSGIGPFASQVLNLNQPIHKESENSQWEKCRYKTVIEKMFSDTAQYFHSKNLKKLHKCPEKHFFFFNGMVFQGQKEIFKDLLRAAPLCQLN